MVVAELGGIRPMQVRDLSEMIVILLPRHGSPLIRLVRIINLAW